MRRDSATDAAEVGGEQRVGRKYEIHTREEGSADEIPPLGDFELDHDEAPASAQATAVPDTPVPPAPFPQDAAAG